MEDENWNKVIIYLGKITTWDNLSEPCRLKAEAYINQLEIFETDKRLYEQLSQFSQSAISILIKASHIEFLRTAIINKLQKISLDHILSLVKSYKDEIFQEKVLNPVLLELSPQATIDQLLLIRYQTSLSSDNTIQTCIEDKMKSLSLEKLTSMLVKSSQDQWLTILIESNLKVKIPNSSLLDLLKAKSQYKSIDKVKPQVIELFDEYIPKKIEQEREELDLPYLIILLKNYSEDDLFINLINDDLKKKIAKASLEDLLNFKQLYKNIEKPDPKIIELFDVSINQRIKDISINDLLDQLSPESSTKSWYQLLDESNNEIIKPILKSYIPLIISRFKKSTSWKNAKYNAQLVSKIAEYLEPTQWEKVLDAFCENNQNYSSWFCEGIFMDLFKESLKINNDVVPDYWISFRNQLEQLKIGSDLKKMIDSYEETYGSSKDNKESQ